MRALSDLMTLVILNLLTLICSLFVVTAGAAVTSMHYCIMKMHEGEDAHITAMYFRAFRENLRDMTPVWLFMLLIGGFFFLDLMMVKGAKTGGERVFIVLVYAGIILLYGLCQWIFPLGARLRNTFPAKLRNAFYMLIGELPRSLCMMAVSAVLPFVLLHSLRLLPLAFSFGLSLPAYLCSFIYYPVIKRLIQE